jgi:hypothetical protein
LRRHVPRAAVLAALLCLPAVSGCSLPRSPTMATVPRSWRNRNPWGPEANAARADGSLQPLYLPEEMDEWEAFGREHIQDGDLLFRNGISYTLKGCLIAFVTAAVCDSPFTHDAIAHWEDGVLYVYDTVPEPEGVRKIPFAFWALDNARHSLVVKRLKPQYRCYIPAALDYIETAYLKQIPFDSSLHLDDERLYCSELLEKAFRSAGVALSEPVALRRFPHYGRYAMLRPLAKLCVGLDVDEPVFAVGNQRYGLFGSPYLEVVFSELPKYREDQRLPPSDDDPGTDE